VLFRSDVEVGTAGNKGPALLRLPNHGQGVLPGAAIGKAQRPAQEHPAQQRRVSILPPLQPQNRLLLVKRQAGKKSSLQIRGERFDKLHSRDMDFVVGLTPLS